MRAPPLLQEFVAAMRELTGADSVVVALHREPADPHSLLLYTDGAQEPVAELADPDAAWQLVQSRPSKMTNVTTPEIRPSVTSDGVLVHVTLAQIMRQTTEPVAGFTERRRFPESGTMPLVDGGVWFGLRGAKPIPWLVRSPGDGDDTGFSQDEAWLRLMTGLATRLTWAVYHLTGALQDPVSELPGRMEFQVFLSRALAAARTHQHPVCLMLINPDDFGMINHRYGHEAGDRTVREIADALLGNLRQSDGVFRYGGAVFGVVLSGAGVNESRLAAEKIRSALVSQNYVDGSVKLTFSIGAAVAAAVDDEAADQESSVLLKRADDLLARAKLSGGARTIVGTLSSEERAGASANPMGAIFTPDTQKDYRNMLLLWETVALVSAHSEPAAIAAAFVDRLALGFQPERVLLLTPDETAGLQPLASNVRDDTSPDCRATGAPVKLSKQSHNLVQQAFAQHQVERSSNDTRSMAYAVPLMAGNKAIGCLYLDGHGRQWGLDSSDVIFLNALASQMAMALDRANLIARWREQKERESRALKGELRDLRNALSHTKMVYQSKPMHELMNTLRQVAPSDATVLIIGESGTGKEMLAQSLHEFSERREAPFVVADCGAVAHTLIEAELFGHVKGAFTGADRNSDGRILQADGGTLFLDEIGELPLSLQAKLLRFVQEKEFTPVGSTKSRRVDVRIVAATNRRLQDEVAEGKFRADLYYRLQVIAVEAIPLRDRTDDILPLAHYFLEKFASQYGSATHAFTAAAERKILHYPWPGNVRELQNCIMRAVLTNSGEELDENAIELLPEASRETELGLYDRAPAATPRVTIPAGAATDQSTGATAVPDATQTSAGEPGRDVWQTFERELSRQIDLAMTGNRRRPVPLGRWLNEDLLLAANEASGEVARRAAMLLGVPESTFRRQLNKVKTEFDQGLGVRTDHWHETASLIDELIRLAQVEPGADPGLLERARRSLLTGVLHEVPGKPSVGAALMGVTTPTYRKWCEAHAQ